MKFLKHKRKSSDTPQKPYSNHNTQNNQKSNDPGEESDSSSPIQKNLQNLLKNKEKLDKIQKAVSPEISYTKFKFKSTYYSIGDKLIIYASNENLIGELTRIIPNNGIKKYPIWPSIEVKWYYKKTDINRKKNNLLDERNYNSISDFELFPTEHKDIVYIETVIGKCEVYSYDEYESLDEHTEFSFFTRARYDPTHQILIPKFDEWSKGCVCKRPLNPDQLYMKCDGCNEWFHPKCCGVKEEDVEKYSSFYCPYCAKERKD